MTPHVSMPQTTKWGVFHVAGQVLTDPDFDEVVEA
jgi:hypothetical protein